MNESIVQNGQQVSLIKDGWSVADVLGQISQIQDLMQKAMKKDEHFGIIPGTKKPSLYKAGAEKLGLMFRLSPVFDVREKEMDRGHREYVVSCTLKHIPSGNTIGSGVGSCCTLEAKYRYRTGEVKFTGKPVPKEYWDNKKENYQKALDSIGGKGYSARKNPDTGKWEIVEQGEKVEHDNPADYYNTVLKMAKKRAHVDAMLTATAASDIFTQDVEELVDNGVIHVPEAHPQEEHISDAVIVEEKKKPEPKKERSPEYYIVRDGLEDIEKSEHSTIKDLESAKKKMDEYKVDKKLSEKEYADLYEKSKKVYNKRFNIKKESTQ